MGQAIQFKTTEEDKLRMGYLMIIKYSKLNSLNDQTLKWLSGRTFSSHADGSVIESCPQQV